MTIKRKNVKNVFDLNKLVSESRYKGRILRESKS